ncbi:MAG TPA: hypothetical protein DD735_11325 [Clostridiales bacterium]|nr:hypothetical protein [Clostridiales bacterium]
MKSRIFLEGPLGCGKSTLIRRTPGLNWTRAGGFVTQRVTDADGGLAGFVLKPARLSACSADADAAYPFLTFGAAASRDDGVFRTEAVRLLREAESAPFAVLDELGGCELLIPEFFAALTRFLSTPTPCVGVLKSPAAADELSNRLHLPESFIPARNRLYAMLRDDPGTLILPTTGRGDAAAESILRRWASQFAQG